MEENTKVPRSRDILSRQLLAFLFFWVPIIALMVTGSANVGRGWLTAVWTTALLIMGAACMVNARRCGRMHCLFTGPFFLVMAAVTLLYGLGVLRLGRNGWNEIGLAIFVGGVGLCCVPELLWGKYRKGRQPE
jgi:hypothetical protein